VSWWQNRGVGGQMITGIGKKTAVVSLFTLPIVVILCLGVVSCDLKKKGNDPGVSFTKIYDKSDEFSYTAVDIKQLADGGYIILGMVDRTPYLLRIGSEGDVKWDTKKSAFLNFRMTAKEAEEADGTDFIQPVADIIIINQEYYFFCSYFSNEKARLALLKISETDPNHVPTKIELSERSLGSAYVIPIDAKAISGDGMLILAANGNTNRIYLQKIDSNGESIWNSLVQIRFNKPCANDYPIADKRYSFIELEEISGSSGIYLHSYSQDSEDYPTCFGIAYMAPDFQTGTYNAEYTAKLPFIAIEWNGTTSSRARIEDGIISFYVNFENENEIPTAQQFELISTKPVCIKTIVVDDREIVFFAGSAKNNKIVLYAYNAIDGTFINKKYFGHTHIYEIAALIETNENGMALLATTYVAGRFGRICLFVLSHSELEDIADRL
jgi:hypothetical protein